MVFEYIKDKTTIDDIIEHILFRLNTDFAGGCLQVPDFCYIKEYHYYDTIMEMKVRDKMYKHDVAKKCTGRGQSDHAIELRPKGAEVYENGGWKKYLVDYQKQEEEKDKRESNSNITNFGNLVYGNNNSEIIQGSNFRDFNTQKKQTMPPMPYETKQNPITSMILKFIKSFIIPLIVGVILLYIEHKTHFFSEITK